MPARKDIRRQCTALPRKRIPARSRTDVRRSAHRSKSLAGKVALCRGDGGLPSHRPSPSGLGSGGDTLVVRWRHSRGDLVLATRTTSNDLGEGSGRRGERRPLIREQNYGLYSTAETNLPSLVVLS